MHYERKKFKSLHKCEFFSVLSLVCVNCTRNRPAYPIHRTKPNIYKHAETKMKSTQAHKTCYILHTCNSEQASHVPHSMYTIHGDAKNEIMTRTMRNYRHIARHDTTQVAQYDTDTGTHTCMGLLRIQKYTNTSGHSHRKILILYNHIHLSISSMDMCAVKITWIRKERA